MKPADLILVRGTGPISEAIEDITHSPYSHVAGLVKENELIEAEGFRKTGYQALDYYAGHADVFACELTDEQRLKIVDFVTKKVGGHYDYLLLVWELLRYELHLLLPYQEPPMSKTCSVLWSDAYRSIGIDLCPGIRYPTPADIAESSVLVNIGSL